MAFTGSICDEEVARRASMSVLQAQSLLGLVDGSLTSLTAAQAQCDTGQALLSITDHNYAVHSKRALKIGNNFGAPVTTSSLADFYAALPNNFGHELRMIS
jgi:hypothetical protein